MPWAVRTWLAGLSARSIMLDKWPFKNDTWTMTDLTVHRDAPALLAQKPSLRWPASAASAVSPGAIEVMGARRLFKQLPQTRAEIHGVLVKGLPYAVLLNLVDQLSALTIDDIAAAVGLSTRTLRRQKDQPTKPMPPDLASKTWQLAETLSQAAAVMGSRSAAERWMARPAMGLDGARPIDLMCTLQGAELVTEFLGRLEHGVYN